MDPALRFEYDLTGIYEIHKYTLRVMKCCYILRYYNKSVFNSFGIISMLRYVDINAGVSG